MLPKDAATVADSQRSVPARESAEIDWTSYARSYDLIPDLIPQYNENIQELRQVLHQEGLVDALSVCDLGAGTGNYVIDMATYLPYAEFIHVDNNGGMNEVAREKYATAGIDNVQVVEEYVQRLDFKDESFDVIVCANALYTLIPQHLVLKKIHRWLKPNGVFFVVDFGRKQSVTDWGWYFLKRSLTNPYYLRSVAKLLTTGIQVAKQAANGTKAQDQGSYWLHSTTEFGTALELAGFRISTLHDCYRGYCDLAVCKKA